MTTRAMPVRSEERPELNLILLGPPGAGKGTQASRLSVQFVLPLISTGDMLRAADKEQTELGNRAAPFVNAGELVPDELIVGMVGERLAMSDVRNGFVLDGFPRTVVQAVALDVQLRRMGRQLGAALLLSVLDCELVRRLTGRLVCTSAGHTYHVESKPPAQPGLCDHDGSSLIQRDDDKPQVIEDRLRVYGEQTRPLIDYYSNLGVLHRIEATGTPGQIASRVRDVIDLIV